MKKKVVNLKRKKSFNKSDKPKESEDSNSETWKESVVKIFLSNKIYRNQLSYLS